MPFPLQWAANLAGKIVGELAPFCERIAIAGSIRRERPVVNDIDLVVLLREGAEAAFRSRVFKHCRPLTQGPDMMIAVLPLSRPAPAVAGSAPGHEIQIDVWFARPDQRDLLESRPSNWGSLLLCRTGSRSHNIWLCDRARKMGLKWNPHHGLYGPLGWPAVTSSAHSRCLASATEDDILLALDLPPIPPPQRER